MKLEEIKTIKQTSDINEVNKALKDGFEIIKIVPTQVKNQDYEYRGQAYILGAKQ